MLKRKAVYEELHSGTKQGGNRKSAKIKRQTVPFEKRDKIKGAECPFDNQEPDNVKTTQCRFDIQKTVMPVVEAEKQVPTLKAARSFSVDTAKKIVKFKDTVKQVVQIVKTGYSRS
ncbi:MAG: hypothetical protein J7K30_15875 [Deltaproteobacteria bacterium]|nr:hypothetical protein [Deltaproteobacteria bacterium]